MKRKILLIEDNEQNRYLVTFLLEAHGCDIVQASDGAQGIELAASATPNLILLDIQLPTMDGHAVARELRKNAALKKPEWNRSRRWHCQCQRRQVHRLIC